MKAISVSQMKKAERKAVEMGVSYLELMENAGIGSTREIVKRYPVLNKSCVILCGNGNNGGDGFVIARKLHEKGANVAVVLCKGEPATQESHVMFEQLRKMGLVYLDMETELSLVLFKLRQADLIIDTVFGTGFHGEITGVLSKVIERANESPAKKIAVDIPSGINGDNGKTEGVYFKADVTLALGAYKWAHELVPSAQKCGNIVLVDIGIPTEAFLGMDAKIQKITKELLKDVLPKREADSNKGDYGKLLILSGCVGMGGAALMCTQSALRCGAGLVTLATSKSLIETAFPHIMEAVTLPMRETELGQISESNLSVLLKRLQGSTACVIGPGLGNSVSTERLVTQLLTESETPIILDADGINVLSLNNNKEILKKRKCDVVLTPHPGEMARLCGKTVTEIQKSREQTAYEFAKEYQVVLVLKGHETLVALPDGSIYQNTTGNPGMAKGGSGDVLAGMIGSFAAQKLSLHQAAVLGVYLHGLTGDLCAAKYTEYGMTARDLIASIPEAFRAFLSEEKENDLLSQF